MEYIYHNYDRGQKNTIKDFHKQNIHSYVETANTNCPLKSKRTIKNKPPLRFELRTPGLQDQCSNH